MVLGKLVNPLQKNETRTLSNTIHKNKLKRIKDLNVRSESIKLLEENIGKTLSDINHSRTLYNPSPRILEIKAKINKWDLIKIKSFCTTKEIISKVKRQPSEWEKIIENVCLISPMNFLHELLFIRHLKNRAFAQNKKCQCLQCYKSIIK